MATTVSAPLQDRTKQRREEFLRRISGGVGVFPSAPTALRNADVEHEYRQNTDFYYLTGFEEPGAVAVFAPEHTEHLARERWSRARTQAWLYDRAWRSLADLKRAGKVEPAFLTNPRLLEWLYRDHPAGVPSPPPDPGAAERITAEDRTVRVHRGLGPDDILLCVGGGEAGGHSAFFPSWSRGRSVPFVTKEVPS